MTNLERFQIFIQKGCDFDSTDIFEDGEKLIQRAWAIDSEGKRKPNTTIYMAWQDSDDEGFDFNTIAEAKAYINA